MKANYFHHRQDEVLKSPYSNTNNVPEVPDKKIFYMLFLFCDF